MMDNFKKIEKFIPEEHRAQYWEIAKRLDKLDPDDEVLLIVEAMALLTFITKSVPTELFLVSREMEKQTKYLKVLSNDLTKKISSAALDLHHYRPGQGSAPARTDPDIPALIEKELKAFKRYIVKLVIGATAAIALLQLLVILAVFIR